MKNTFVRAIWGWREGVFRRFESRGGRLLEIERTTRLRFPNHSFLLLKRPKKARSRPSQKKERKNERTKKGTKAKAKQRQENDEATQLVPNPLLSSPLPQTTTTPPLPLSIPNPPPPAPSAAIKLSTLLINVPSNAFFSSTLRVVPVPVPVPPRTPPSPNAREEGNRLEGERSNALLEDVDCLGRRGWWCLVGVEGFGFGEGWRSLLLW